MPSILLAIPTLSSRHSFRAQRPHTSLSSVLPHLLRLPHSPYFPFPGNPLIFLISPIKHVNVSLVESLCIICLWSFADCCTLDERNAVSIAASPNKTSRSCSFLLAEILIFFVSRACSIRSHFLLHLRHLNIRCATLCLLSLHHQHRASCILFVLIRCTPVTACPDFSCRYRVATAFFASLMCLLSLGHSRPLTFTHCRT